MGIQEWRWDEFTDGTHQEPPPTMHQLEVDLYTASSSLAFTAFDLLEPLSCQYSRVKPATGFLKVRGLLQSSVLFCDLLLSLQLILAIGNIVV